MSRKDNTATLTKENGAKIVLITPTTNVDQDDVNGWHDDSGVGDDETGSRVTWSRKVEYILTTIGYCVGLGNVLRFPYICIRNGGGAFLIPYLLCLTVCGIPLFFLEVAIGQFVSRGALHVWTMCPMFKGIGITMMVLSLLSAWCYTMMLAYTLIFAVGAVQSPQPWTLCGQSWNSDRCAPPGESGAENHTGTTFFDGGNTTTVGGVFLNGTRKSDVTGSISASREFWLNNVLELSSGFHDMGGLPWHTSLALLIATSVIFACVIKGVKSVGKVAYVTATLPYLLLTVLMINGATLTGAGDGVLFYITPDFNKLMSVQPWVESTIQVFYSLGPAYGSLITMASYNKFDNNCLRDAVVLSFLCEGTSVFAGFAIFPVLGHMARTLNTSLSTFATAGPGLAFVVYPEAISYLPVPQLWGVLFFLMLFVVGLDSQFSLVETVLTGLLDSFPKLLTRWSLAVKIVFWALFFLASLPFATRGGMYLFQLVDWYFAAFTILANGILECIVIGWVYGAERLLDDVHIMTGRKPPYIMALLWRFITPTLLAIILVSTLSTYKPPVYEGYVFGQGAVAFGWIFATFTFLPIPAYAIYKLVTAKGSLKQRLKSCCTPSKHWKPDDKKLREQYLLKTKYSGAGVCSFSLPCLPSTRSAR